MRIIQPLRPVVMSAGRGTRLDDHTNDHCKALIPICDEPLLLHVVRRLEASGYGRPLVVLGETAERVEKSLGPEHFDSLHVPRWSILESMLIATESDSADAFVGFNGDTLIDLAGLTAARLAYERSPARNLVVLTRGDEERPRRFEWVAQSGRLRDVRPRQHRSVVRRVATFVTRRSIAAATATVERPVIARSSPSAAHPLGSGWGRMMRALLDTGATVSVAWVDARIVNVNTRADLTTAELFVAESAQGLPIRD